MPERVRVQGDLFHGRIPAGAVYIGRGAPGLRASAWANPFRPGRFAASKKLPEYLRGVFVADQAHAVELYAMWLWGSVERCEQAERELAGRDLACWCQLGDPCHGVPLMQIANRCRRVSLDGLLADLDLDDRRRQGHEFARFWLNARVEGRRTP